MGIDSFRIEPQANVAQFRVDFLVKYGAYVRNSKVAQPDEHLLLEQQRLGGHSTGAARAEEFRDGYEKVNREEQQIAHGAHRITPEIVGKTVR